MSVTFTNVNHVNPDDLDIYLVGPTGATMGLMSDCGGTPDLVGVNITLDDAAVAGLPDATVIASGTYKPTNTGTGDTPVLPALPPYSEPATAGAATLTSVFGGTNPNGTWTLYVTDDATGNSGAITGGWSLNFTTTPVELQRFTAD